MTQPFEHLSRTDRSIGGVLSAVGSLLLALGGERGAPASPAAEPASEPIAQPPAPMVLPPSAIPPTRARAEVSSTPADEVQPGAGDPATAVGALLADARARAQAIMDESMARAEELLRPPEAADEATLTGINRTVAQIATEVRVIHARLEAIEALLRGQPDSRATAEAAASDAPASETAGPAERPAFGSAPPVDIPAPPPPWVPAPEHMGAPPAPETPPQAPPLPTSWAGLATPPEAGAPAPSSAAPASTEPAAVDAFDPMAGAVSLRIAPVAGFQGLMRVQDALVRIRGVREAGVEAYAQGEARLRLRLSAAMDAAAISAALADLLGRPTRVISASKSERTLQLELE